MKEPIGRVLYFNGSIIAELWGVDDWKVIVHGKEHPGMARGLTALYADTYLGPADGHYGQLILKDLAERTGGTMTIMDFPRSDIDEVN
jgi:hypothetical protein